MADALNKENRQAGNDPDYLPDLNPLFAPKRRGRPRKSDVELRMESYSSSNACKKNEAKDILRERRKLTQSYIVNAAYELGVIAAKKLRIVPNIFFWTNGVLNMLESIET